MRRSTLGRLAALLAVLALSTGCSSGRVLHGNATIPRHVVILHAEAPESLEVRYLNARGKSIDIAQAGSSWSVELDETSGRWVSFVAYPAPSDFVEVVKTPTCSITVDGRLAARASSSETASCDLAGWVAAKPPRKHLSDSVSAALLAISMAGAVALFYRTIRLAMPG